MIPYIYSGMVYDESMFTCICLHNKCVMYTIVRVGIYSVCYIILYVVEYLCMFDCHIN